ncbi:hypothetical protein BU23DRAFT_161929, partial [Bimuria novae-zelandiae CBS 107.79]
MPSKIRYHDLRASAEDEDEFALPHSSNSPLFGPSNTHAHARSTRKKAILTIAALTALTLYIAAVLAVPPSSQPSARTSTPSTTPTPPTAPPAAPPPTKPNPSAASSTSCTEAGSTPRATTPRNPPSSSPSTGPSLNADIPPSQLKYEHEVIATEKYHWAHCLYSLKMVHWAALGGMGGMVSMEVRPMGHTEHCLERIRKYDPRESWVFGTTVQNYYSVCYQL